MRKPDGASSLKIAITPPAALPYNAENGPRNTSMRSADDSEKCETCPEPSGMLAGMPSA